jgi:hypothetical protein
MGGEVFVGIRTEDGSEHLSLRWTNLIPWVFAQPSFYEEPYALRQDFIEAATPEHSWPQSVKVTSIEKSEYGVILVDFKNKEVLSRQDYTRIGGISGTHLLDEDWAGLAKQLREAGWVSCIADHVRRDTPMSKEAQERLWASMGNLTYRTLRAPDGRLQRLHAVLSEPLFNNKYLEGVWRYIGYLPPSPMVLFCPPGWAIDHKVDRPTRSEKTWREIQEWLRAFEWTSKIEGVTT